MRSSSVPSSRAARKPGRLSRGMHAYALRAGPLASNTVKSHVAAIGRRTKPGRTCRHSRGVSGTTVPSWGNRASSPRWPSAASSDWLCSMGSGREPVTIASAACRSSAVASSARACRAAAQASSRWDCAEIVPPDARGRSTRRPAACRSVPNALRSTYQPYRCTARASRTSSLGGSAVRAPGLRTAWAHALVVPATKAAAAASGSCSVKSPHSSVRPGRGRTSRPGESIRSVSSIRSAANVSA